MYIHTHFPTHIYESRYAIKVYVSNYIGGGHFYTLSK